MSSNYIIELNQNDTKSSVRGNGDYSVNIDKKTILNEGDSILLNKCFIDTVAQANDVIKITEDTPLSIEFSKYVWNISGDSLQLNYNNQGANNLPYDSMASPLLVCKTTGTPVLQIVEVDLDVDDGGKPFGNDTVVTFTYTDFENAQRKGQITLVGLRTQPLILLYFLKVGTTPTILNQAETFKAANVKGLTFKYQTINDTLYVPVNYTANFTLPAGNYNPVELGSIISDGFQTAVAAGTEYSGSLSDTIQGSNSLFKTLNTGDVLIPTENTQKALNNNLQDYAYQYNVTANNKVYAGTNQFAFEWLPEYNKFAFSTIHTPLTDSNGNPSFKGAQVTNNNVVPGVPQSSFGNAGKVSLVSSYSGIMFNSLSPTSFWEDNLGFKVQDLTSWNTKTYLQQTSDNDLIFPAWSWKPGTYQTTGQVLLAGLTNKGPNQITPITGADFQTIYTNISDSTEITAANQILNARTTPQTSYFLIEINSKFKNDFISASENNRNIQAIVSTYYSTNSSTIGNSEDAIVYTHRGSPIELSGFDVRILKDDKTISSDIINNNNVIFLQVVRASPNINQDNMITNKVSKDKNINKSN
jgi:hypothetical protein